MFNRIFIILFLSFTFQSFSQKVFTTTSTGTWGGASWSCTGTGCSSGTEKPGTNLSGNTINVNHAITTGFPSFNVNSGGVANLNINANVSSMSSASLSVSGFGNRVNFTNNSSSSIGNVTSTARLDLILNQPLTMASLNVTNFDGLMNISGASTLTVTGDMSIQSSATVTSNSNISVGGNFLANNGGTTFTMNKPMTVTGNVTIQDAVNVVFNGTLSGNNLNVPNSSTVTFNKLASFAGSITMNSSSGQILGNGAISWGTTLNLSNGSNIDGNANCNATSSGTKLIDFKTCGTVLPIVLKAFNVEYFWGDFDFKWATFQEIDNDYFRLEYSFDAKNFIDFAKVEGAGTSYQTLEYQYLDSKLSFERDVDVVYFRLKQTDYDGTYAYSHVVPVMLSNKYKLSSSHFYPNPATENLTLRIGDWDRYKEGLVLDFINASGKVYSKSISINSTETKIDLTDLPKGIYMISSGGLFDTVKLLVN
jgi:hypothetical protein